MLRITSPQIATRSDSRKKITSPRAWPGAWTTRKPATSSPSWRTRSTLYGGPCQSAADQAVDRVARGGLLDRALAFHRVDVVGVAGERHAARLADVLGDALVVGVDVGQRHQRELDSLQLGEDPPPVPAPAGVDQHVLGQVDVDRSAPGTPSAARHRGPGTSSVAYPERAAGVAAVLGELLQAGDLALAFEPGRVVGGQRLDQARGSGCGPAARSGGWRRRRGRGCPRRVIGRGPPPSSSGFSASLTWRRRSSPARPAR